MSESLIVEVRRLRDAQKHIKARLESVLSQIGAPALGGEDINELLDLLDEELEFLVDRARKLI